MSPRWRREHLAYCSNVHPGEHLADVRRVVRRHIAAVRALRGLDYMATGLWLSASAAHALASEPQALTEFRATLDESGLELRTLNGFPYGDFHGESVKQQVYRPDWTDRRRGEYILALARVLQACLPGDAREGTISTLPLGWRESWTRDRHAAALLQLCETAAALQALARDGGRPPVRLCLEMEPGCVLESTDDALRLFSEELPRAARQAGVSRAALRDHLGVCLDVCHQAVVFEHGGESLAALCTAGIAVGKIQISSALHVDSPRACLTQLARYDEPRYLHQVRARDRSGTIRGSADLGPAMQSAELLAIKPWRVHFHLPVQAAGLVDGVMSTTREQIEHLLDTLAATPHTPQLEVETYTWEVLPEAMRPHDTGALQRGLTAELTWLERAMNSRGLLAV